MVPSSRVTSVGSAAPPQPRPGWHRHAGALAGILLLGLFAYSNSFHGPFVFDDRQNIRDNTVIRDLSNYLASWAGYRWMPQRFVAYLTFALNYRLGALEVAGYHAFNVGIHLLCALLVYALVVLTFRTPRLEASSLAPWSRAVAFAASALFVTHPVQTQAVTYIVQRITSLATLFYVLSVVLYAWWRLSLEAQARPKRRAAVYTLALLSTIAAMKTKEIAFTLPFVIVLYELAFFEGRRSRLLRLAPFLATALVIPATLLDLHGSGGAVLAETGARTRADSTLPRLDYLRTEIAVIGTYLRLLVLPVGQNFDYEYPIYRSFLTPRVLSSLALIASLLAAGIWLHRRSTMGGERRSIDPAARLVSFGIGWFFITLLVESSVIPIDDVINEHRVYLPSIGLFGGIATGGALLLKRVPRADPARITALAALLLAILLAVATLRRNAVWGSDVSLWADTAAKSPNKVRVLGNLAVALAAAGYPAEGVLPLRRAVNLEPRNAIARLQLGAALAALGRTAEAEPELRESIRLDPKRPEPLFNLGLLLSRTGRAPEAKQWFQRFLEIAPPSYVGMRQVAEARVRSTR
jgi:hypothetical protein